MDGQGERFDIGVVAPLVGNPYCGALVGSIAAEVTARGGRVTALQTLDVAAGGTRPQDRHWAGDRAPTGCPPGLGWSRLDALVVLVGGGSKAYLEAAERAGKPLLLVSHEVLGLQCPVVRPDNVTGVSLAVDHLVAHGCDNIAFVGDLSEDDIKERFEAYKAALQRHDRHLSPELVLETSGNRGQGVEEVAARIAAGVACDAVVAATDSNAIVLMDALSRAGVRVPHDVAVIGFDNTAEARLCNPPLSSVDLSFADVGRLAGSLVTDMALGLEVPPTSHLAGARLVLRASCGCSPGALDSDSVADLNDVTARLCSTLAIAGPGPTEVATDLVALLAAHMRAAADEEQMATVPADVTSSVRELFAAGADLTTAMAVPVAGRQLVQLLKAEIRPEALVGTTLLFSRVGEECARAVLHRQAVMISGGDASRRDLFDISVDLLWSGSGARSLRWLAGTEAVAGCLGLWEGGPEGEHRKLEVVGTFGMGNFMTDNPLGPSVPLSEFPPPELGCQDDGSGRAVTYLMPLRTKLHDWGVLAVVGPVWERGLGRDIYYQWSSMLSMALDHEATLASLGEQREKFSNLYERQSALAHAMQKSGERYALASQATNDGLLDWQLTSGQVYYSRRFLELLGFNASLEAASGTIDEWLSAVYPEDRPALEAKLAELRRPDGDVTSFELEHRVVVGPGELRWVLCKAIVARDADGQATRVVGSLADINGRKSLEERLSYEALHDSLTQLANRALVSDRIRQALRAREAAPAHDFAILWLDLDRFKIVNDSMGHRAGDALLQEVARRLKSQLRQGDTAARLGGDEFVVVIDPMPPSVEALDHIVDRLQQSLAAPYIIDGHEVSISASVGVVTSAMSYNRAEDILRDADVAMYSAKQAERGSKAVFTPDMHHAAEGRLRVVTDLRHAISRRELTLEYQPIVELASGRTTGFEALVRWPRPDGKTVQPGDFLPVAREAGLMPLLGEHVLTEACSQLSAWRRARLLPEGATITVNVSHEEFWHGGFLADLDRAIAICHGGPPGIEITEGIVMEDIDAALAILRQLRYRGCRLYMDDFGTGRSSLEAVRDLPVDALKIDRSFVSGMADSPQSIALVRTVMQMAEALDLTVIAEGVETAAEADMLCELGCIYGQGYWFARPLTVSQAFERLQKEHQPGPG